MKTVFTTVLLLIAATAGCLADPSILEAQKALKDQGFYYGAINGQKDADTTAAIRRFQIRNGLEINGELNDETLNSIRSAEKRAAQAAPPAATPVPPAGDDTSDLRADAGRQGSPIAAPLGEPNPPAAAGDQWTDQPNIGRHVPSDTGLFAGTPYQTAPVQVQRRVITDAQRILAGRGLFKDPIDGAFGPGLEFSLRAYQSRVGIPVTGQLDLQTLAALQLLPGAHAPIYTPRRPILRRETPVRGEWVRP